MTLSSLARIQHDFQDYLMRATAGIVDHVSGTERVSVATRLRIYGEAYYSRLTEALEANYPALAQLIGERDFIRLAAEYIATHDSHFHSIRYYGDALAQYLATEPRYRSVPLLADLARWEWTMAAVFDAADADVIDVHALGEVCVVACKHFRDDEAPAEAAAFLRGWIETGLVTAVT